MVVREDREGTMRRHYSAVLALLFTLSACSGAPMANSDSTLRAAPRSMGTLNAVVDDSAWTAGFVEVRRDEGVLSIIATAFGISDEDRQFIRLTLETGVGVAPQMIGPGYRRSANLVHDFVAGWLAEGSLGSGTLRFSSLTDDRAIGTFSFIGVSTSPVTPRTRVVKDGSFNVQLR
jgi:hypothetical protein